MIWRILLPLGSALVTYLLTGNWPLTSGVLATTLISSLFRKQLSRLKQKLADKNPATVRVVTLLASIVSAVAAYLFTEKSIGITILAALMPFISKLLCKPLSLILFPLLWIVKKLPTIVRIGISMAIPFCIGIVVQQQDPQLAMVYSMILGAPLAYAIMSPGSKKKTQKGKAVAASTILPFFLLLFWAVPVMSEEDVPPYPENDWEEYRGNMFNILEGGYKEFITSARIDVQVDQKKREFIVTPHFSFTLDDGRTVTEKDLLAKKPREQEIVVDWYWSSRLYMQRNNERLSFDPDSVQNGSFRVPFSISEDSAQQTFRFYFLHDVMWHNNPGKLRPLRGRRVSPIKSITLQNPGKQYKDGLNYRLTTETGTPSQLGTLVKNTPSIPYLEINNPHVTSYMNEGHAEIDISLDVPSSSTNFLLLKNGNESIPLHTVKTDTIYNYNDTVGNFNPRRIYAGTRYRYQFKGYDNNITVGDFNNAYHFLITDRQSGWDQNKIRASWITSVSGNKPLPELSQWTGVWKRTYRLIDIDQTYTEFCRFTVDSTYGRVLVTCSTSPDIERTATVSGNSLELELNNFFENHYYHGTLSNASITGELKNANGRVVSQFDNFEKLSNNPEDFASIQDTYFKAQQKIADRKKFQDAMSSGVMALFLTGLITLPQLLSLLGSSTAGTTTGATETTNTPHIADAKPEDEEDSESDCEWTIDASLNSPTLQANTEGGVTLFTGIVTREEGVQAPPLSAISVHPTGSLAEFVHIQGDSIDAGDSHRNWYVEFYTTEEQKEIQDSLPATVTIAVSATHNGITRTQHVTLKVQGKEAEIRVQKENLVVPFNSSAISECTGYVKNSGTEWDFSIEPSDSAIYTSVQIKKTSSSRFLLTAQRTGSLPVETSSITENYIIRATQQGKELTCTESITVVRDGVLIQSVQPFTVFGDSYQKTELRISAITVNNGRAETDFRALEQIAFGTIRNSDPRCGKAYETAKITFSFSKWENVSSALNKSGEFASVIYEVYSENEVPGRKGDSFDGSMDITAGPYSTQLSLLLTIPEELPESVQKEIEYDRCVKIIDKHVPEQYRAKFHQILEIKKDLLGSKGLYELRHTIWKIAQKQWEAEGLSGYNRVAEIAEFYEDVLSTAEWLGGICFSAAMFPFFGPYGHMAVTTAKDLAVSALKAYMNDTSAEEWFDAEFRKLLLTLPAEGLTQASMKGLISNGTAFALAMAYQFAVNLYQTRDAWEAAKATAVGLRDMALTMLFSKLAMKSAMKHNLKVDQSHLNAIQNDPEVATSKTPQKPYTLEELPDSAQKIMKNMENGWPKDADIVACMKDSQVVRSIKNGPIEVKKAFVKGIRKINREHDIQLKKELTGSVDRNGKPYEWSDKPLKIKEIRTPKEGQTFKDLLNDVRTNPNTDRDFVVTYKDKNGVWREVPHEHFEHKSNSIIKNITGASAEELRIEATDMYHREAARDVAYYTIDGKTGKVIKLDRPNLLDVVNGKGKLNDPQGLGNMYKEKVDTYFREGNIPESVAQAKKTINVLGKVRNGYSQQGYSLDAMPENLKKAFQIIADAPTDHTATPSVMKQMNESLNKLGFPKGVQSVNDKAASFMEALKTARR